MPHPHGDPSGPGSMTPWKLAGLMLVAQVFGSATVIATITEHPSVFTALMMAQALYYVLAISYFGASLSHVPESSLDTPASPSSGRE